jgi:hypothetical protein
MYPQPWRPVRYGGRHAGVLPHNKLAPSVLGVHRSGECCEGRRTSLKPPLVALGVENGPQTGSTERAKQGHRTTCDAPRSFRQDYSLEHSPFQ